MRVFIWLLLISVSTMEQESHYTEGEVIGVQKQMQTVHLLYAHVYSLSLVEILLPDT